MSKYKIGITEAGDAGIDFSWEQKLGDVDGAILITKCVSEKFCEAVMRHKEKVIVHATITGFGGTVLEPNVPPFYANKHCGTFVSPFARLNKLVEAGFPRERIVIRVDPIIPTPKACKTAEKVIFVASVNGYDRFRISILDMYPHVRQRFLEKGLPLPYGDNFAPAEKDYQCVMEALASAVWLRQMCHIEQSPRFEACAEPGLNSSEDVHIIHTGCISAYDLKLLGLDPDDDDAAGYQRKGCLCYSGKTELLNHKEQCPNGCLYCYWKSKK